MHDDSTGTAVPVEHTSATYVLGIEFPNPMSIIVCAVTIQTEQICVSNRFLIFGKPQSDLALQLSPPVLCFCLQRIGKVQKCHINLDYQFRVVRTTSFFLDDVRTESNSMRKIVEADLLPTNGPSLLTILWLFSVSKHDDHLHVTTGIDGDSQVMITMPIGGAAALLEKPFSAKDITGENIIGILGPFTYSVWGITVGYFIFGGLLLWLVEGIGQVSEYNGNSVLFLRACQVCCMCRNSTWILSLC